MAEGSLAPGETFFLKREDMICNMLELTTKYFQESRYKGTHKIDVFEKEELWCWERVDIRCMTQDIQARRC